MPRRIQVTDHLSPEELHARYRTAKHPVEKTHWQVLWLIQQGKTSRAVAEATGYTPAWVRALVSRYNQGGPAVMEDGRRGRSGRRSLLSAEQQAELVKALEGPAPSGGLWSGPEVARWIGAKLGRKVPPQRGWIYLRRAGHTPQAPRPRHEEADPEAQRSFQGERAARARSPGAAGAPGRGGGVVDDG